MKKELNKECESIGVMKIEMPVLKFIDADTQHCINKIKEELEELESEIFDFKCGVGSYKRLLRESFHLLTTVFTFINHKFTEYEIKQYSYKNIKDMLNKFGKVVAENE